MLNSLYEQSRELAEGQRLVIRCPVTATPPPFISWLKDNNPLNKSNDDIFIDAVSLSDSGNYTCIATNKHGHASTSFLVHVQSERFKVHICYLVTICWLNLIIKTLLY